MKYETRRNICFILSIFFSCIYLLWRLFFTLPLKGGLFEAVFGVLLLLSEAITTLGTFELYLNRMKTAKYDIPLLDLPYELYPDVDVFIATHNEPVDILYKTVNACVNMDYPDKSKVHIYLCDDGNRSEMAELARNFSIGYLGMEKNTHAKSGNYNNALSKTSSPIIATFDADMIPQSCFLMKTVPYFFAQEWVEENGTFRRITSEELERQKIRKLALLQTPQSFFNPDLFQFNLYLEDAIPNEQDFFSREVNITRNSSNSVSYTGSGALLLREAMDEIGGFPYRTITEDFETSLRMQKAGYLTYATTEVLSQGLTTTTVLSMIRQRIRWARGIIQSVKNTHAIFTLKLPLRSRITYLNAFLYWWSFFARIIFILAPIMFALFDRRVVDCTFWDILIFWLPSYFFYSLSMRYLSSNIRNMRWSQTIDTILCPFLIIPVFLETFGIHSRKFVVTKKTKDSNLTGNLFYALPYAILIALSVAACIRFIRGKYGMALVYSSVVIFWLLYNLIALIYALFFMLGRVSRRRSERIRAQEAILVRQGDQTYRGITSDLSDGGLSFILPGNIQLPIGVPIEAEISTARYEAKVLMTLIVAKSREDAILYSAQVTPVDETAKRNFMQIIYDRSHTLPKTLDTWLTPFDVISSNVLRRLHPAALKKKTTRYPIGRTVTMSDGHSVKIEVLDDYVLWVQPVGPWAWTLHQQIRLELDSITLQLEAVIGGTPDDPRYFLLIKNTQELMDRNIHLEDLQHMISEKKEAVCASF